jgi:hypothetical protein
MDSCLNDFSKVFTPPWLLQFAGGRYVTPQFADAVELPNSFQVTGD